MHIIFDIGGTKTRVASALSSESFNDPVILDTPQSYDDGIDLLKKTVLSLSGGQPITQIIGGIAGPWDDVQGTLISSDNLPDWAGKPLKQDLEKSFYTTVSIDNDAVMVGIGEAVFGAGKGYEIVAYITVSTGVGGAKIVHGKVEDHSVGFEPGKQILDAEGHTLEDLISGKALEKRTGKKPIDIRDEVIWDSLAKNLAFGLNNIIVDWSPDVVVLGGSMMNHVGISVEKTQQYVTQILKVFPIVPPIKKATLGDIGGLYGGLARMRKNA